MKRERLPAALAHAGALAIAIAQVAPTNAQAQATTTPQAETPPAQTVPDEEQDAPVAAAEADGGNDIVVTGSRTITDGSSAPTPVTVVGDEELVATNPRNIAEGIASLPAFRGSTGTNTPGLATALNNTGSFLNLRNLGAQRTLVLLDGRRVAPAANNGATNFNLLPQSLIDRVDVVTGGASAAYGSDAVAGVVNVITDRDFTGIKGSVQAGISDEGDAGSQRLSLTGGAEFLDGRLHLLATALYNKTDPILNARLARDWADRGAGRLIIGSGASQYSQIFYGINQNNYEGGVILSGAGSGPANLVGAAGLFPTGVKFLPGGVSSRYDPGTFVTANNAVGGDGSRNSVSLAGGLEFFNVFSRATYEVSPGLEVFAQLIGSKATNVYEPSTNQNVTATRFTIFQGNPFIPADVATALAASTPTTTAGTACGAAAGTPTVALRCFKLSRIHNELLDGVSRIRNNAENKSVDVVIGFDADVFGSFKLSGYYEYGYNLYHTATQKNAVWERLFAAADAVRDPATGNIACRVTLTNPGLYPGCVPMNLFGLGSPSAESLAYAFATSVFDTEIKQNVAALNFAGSVAQLPGGPLAIAIGAEARSFSVDQRADPGNVQIKTGTGIRGFPSSLVGLPGIYNFGNVSVFDGIVRVKEIYGEVNLPLVADVPLVRQLELNAAGRYTDYSTSGGVTTYKLGLSYKPFDALRLRGTYSRDIRAPSPVELFQGNGQGALTVIDPFNGSATFNILRSIRGNTALEPEKADTYTLGGILQPGGLPGFTLAVDYYNITVKEAIGNLTPQVTLDQCFAGNQVNCANVIRDGNGIITTILLPYLNLSVFKTSGVDVELSYRTSIGAIPGTFALRGFLGYLATFETQAPGSPPIDSAGQVGSEQSNPRVKAQATLGWDNGPLGLLLRANYVGRGLQNKQLTEAPSGPNTIIDNSVPDIVTFDLNARYAIGEDQNQEFFATVNNILDKDPPVVPGTNSANFIQTNFDLYETIGRYVTVGLRFKF